MAVFEYKLLSKVSYQRVKNDFKIPFSIEEKERIIELWGKYKNGIYFNTDNIRLQDIEDLDGRTIISVSKTDFFSLVIANIIRSQIDEFKAFIQSDFDSEYEIYLVNKLTKYYAGFGEHSDFISLIRSGDMPNAMAVSVLLIDSEDNILLVKRTGKVAIGANLYSVTSTGAIDSDDWSANDIIKNCAVRELEEELNIRISTEQMDVPAIVAGKNKQQPIAIVNAYLDEPVRDYIRNVEKGSDFSLEVEKIHLCRRNDIADIVKEQMFTEAAEYHLNMIKQG